MSDQYATCKVVLLNPPTADPSPVMLLGLAYLSAVLKEAGHEVLVLDATAPHRPLSEADVLSRIGEFAPHFVGITLTVDFIVDTYEFMGRLRGLGIPIVAGGPHATCLPEEVLARGADVVAVGEGERTVVELADHFLGRRPLAEIAGLCIPAEDGRPVFTAKRTPIKDLDTIPLPDHASFPISNYTGSNDPDSNPMFWSLFTSRGCPFDCTFCSNEVFGRSYRLRSPRNVMAEIAKLVREYGTTFFAFQDDEAFIKEKRIVEFCELVRESGLDVEFSARLRIDSLSESLLRALAETGFCRLGFGVESWNNETLKRVNKKYTVEKVARGFELIARSGFPAVSFNNIVGFPWETEEHLRSSLEHIGRIPPEVTYYSFVATPIPYPGTKLYEDYHGEYGFTEWWLDPRRNSQAALRVDKRAFFWTYARGVLPLYAQHQFWNYSPKMRRAIERYCWEIFSSYVRRCVSLPEYLFIYGLSRLSYRLWGVAPLAERILLAPFKAIGRWWKLPKKIAFSSRRSSKMRHRPKAQEPPPPPEHTPTVPTPEKREPTPV